MKNNQIKDRSRLNEIVQPLTDWYRQNKRILPWRDQNNAYYTWVSEIMLQQTRVEAVKPYFQRFIGELPDVQALAECPEEKLMKLWEGLGYYSRVRNMQAAAKQVMEEYDGKMPADHRALLRLKGIGPYTAGAVASIAFSLPFAAVDGNVLRVMSRVFADERDIMLQQTKRAWEEEINDALTGEIAGDVNQALMELGALVCLPNGAPKCEVCPLAAQCKGRAAGRAEQLPVKTAKPEKTLVPVTAALITGPQGVLLQRRPSKGLLAGLWEYPNEEAPAWDLAAQLGLEAADLTQVGQGKHIFTHIEWHMTAFQAQLPQDALPEDWVWADRAALERDYAVPNAFQAFAGAVEARL